MTAAKRFLRHLLAATAVVSGGLCVLTCIIWVRSYRFADTVPFSRHGIHWQANAYNGMLILDNDPQLEIEEWQRRERCDQGVKQFLRLARQLDAADGALRAFRDAGVPQDQLQPLADNLKQTDELAKQLAEHNYAMFTEDLPTTAERHSVWLVVLSIGLGILPVAWLVFLGWSIRGARHGRKQRPSAV